MSFKSKLSLYATVIGALVAYPALAYAAGEGAPANKFDTSSWLALGAALAIGLAALGGTTGQGRATAAALEGIARQPSAAPRILTPMILGLALIESLVLFAFVVAFMLQGKIEL
ncbi:MAG: ATP synthase F0 subunit C [Deltaproteobacteria bacterium]|nr:ATP synthase F0 subunit C [Deltaproteobacteria bacterium]